MKFIGLISFLTAVTGTHSWVIERDVKAIVGVISGVQGDLDGLDTVIKSWTSNPAPILDASNKLIATINSGTTTVKKSKDLGLEEAIQLLKPVHTFKKHSKTLLDDLKQKKDLVQTQGLCEAASHLIGGVDASGKALISAIISKVPKEAQEIAQDEAEGIVDYLKEAEDTFSEKNCSSA